jgi:hypothetical protein
LLLTVVVHSLKGGTGSHALAALQPLKQPKKETKDLDESDLAFQAKKKEEVSAIVAKSSRVGYRDVGGP